MAPRRRAACLALFAATVTCSLASVARAGNADPFYLGSGAAVQAGAITADAEGGGAIWYNPAGLARLPSLRLDVSMNAYSLRLGGHPDLEAGPNGKVTRLTTPDYNIVPSAFTLTSRLGHVGLGLGIFVPVQQTVFLRTHIVEPPAGEVPGVDFGVDVYGRLQEYFVGPALAWSLAPGVDVGGSLLVHYRNELGLVAVDTSVSVPESATVDQTAHNTLDWQQIGLALVLGVQLQATRHWRLGFTLRLPSLRLYQVQQTVNVQTLGVDPTGPVQHTSEFDEISEFSLSTLTPGRFHVGTSKEFGPTRLALDLSYQAPHRNSEQGEDFAPTLNARLGVRHQITKTFALGGGLFTDRSPEREARNFGDTRIHYYGVTLAVDSGTPYKVVDRGGKKLDPPGGLIFGTTVGLSYAYGIGDIVRAQVGSDPETGLGIEEVSTEVIAHEFTIHLGSTLSE